MLQAVSQIGWHCLQEFRAIDQGGFTPSNRRWRNAHEETHLRRWWIRAVGALGMPEQDEIVAKNLCSEAIPVRLAQYLSGTYLMEILTEVPRQLLESPKIEAVTVQ
jgi:hypothetical protein